MTSLLAPKLKTAPSCFRATSPPNSALELVILRDESVLSVFALFASFKPKLKTLVSYLIRAEL